MAGIERQSLGDAVKRYNTEGLACPEVDGFFCPIPWKSR